MSKLLPTAPNSRFAGWTHKDLASTAAAAGDDTQDVNVRHHVATCLRDYLTEISDHTKANSQP